jgi:hypothetical protein
MRKQILMVATLLIVLAHFHSMAQAVLPKLTAKQVRAELAKYPTRKSSLCVACRLWVNPFYVSIADTVNHWPVVEHYLYTNQHRLMQQAMGTDNRTGQEAEWHPAPGAANEKEVYSYANAQIGRPNSPYEIAYGHCGAAWILLAWCQWGMVYSDVYTYNAAMEYQGQNVGTEIATENYCRGLLGWSRSGEIAPITAKIDVWGGCWGDSKVSYTVGGVTVHVPLVYWKVIRYTDMGGVSHIESWWMPNKFDETADLISARTQSLQYISNIIGFDPTKAIPQ